MKARTWNLLVVGCMAAVLAIWGGVTMFVDPFLHYHGGQDFLEYPLKDERYQNDGIARHYEYDSLITGTSMSQNFRCSEFNELWGAQAIKVANSGASFHESGENIRRAFSYNDGLTYVLCSLDGSRLNMSASYDEYEGYPMYLYDDNPFNDVTYLLNKEVLPKTIAVLNYTRSGQKTPDMDEYQNWSRYKTFGKDSVMASFTLLEEADVECVLTDEDILRIRENVGVNFLELAREHPETDFYFFIPPYSICYWEALVRTRQLDSQLEAQKVGAQVLLSAANVQVYDFSYRIDIIENLDNYTDAIHYGEWINSEMLRMMSAGEGLLTGENIEEYYDSVRELYEGYDYSAYKKAPE